MFLDRTYFRQNHLIGRALFRIVDAYGSWSFILSQPIISFKNIMKKNRYLNLGSIIEHFVEGLIRNSLSRTNRCENLVITPIKNFA